MDRGGIKILITFAFERGSSSHKLHQHPAASQRLVCHNCLVCSSLSCYLHLSLHLSLSLVFWPVGCGVWGHGLATLDGWYGSSSGRESIGTGTGGRLLLTYCPFLHPPSAPFLWEVEKRPAPVSLPHFTWPLSHSDAAMKCAMLGLLGALVSPAAGQFWGTERCPEDERMFRSAAGILIQTLSNLP